MTFSIDRARWLLRMGLALVIVVGATVLTPGGRAAACSCGLEFPTVADQVGRSEIAFVGRLESTDRGEFGPGLYGDTYDLRYELTVEHAVKGVNEGDRVVMFGDTDETSCGTSELDESAVRHAVLVNRFGFDRFVGDSTPPCSRLPSIEDLLAVDLQLPATVDGPVSLIVDGRLGEAELISYDVDGQPVAYGDASAQRGRLAVCPRSERFVQFEREFSEDRVPTMTVRDVATLNVISRTDVAITTDRRDGLDQFLVSGSEVACLSADGSEVVAIVPWENASDGQTRSVRLRLEGDGTVEVARHGRVSRARLDANDSLVGVVDGSLVRFEVGVESDGVVVAELTDGSDAEAAYEGVLNVSDGVGGHWVGLGDGDFGFADRLLILVHVAADGSVERWPVEPPVEGVYLAELDGNELTTDSSVIPLPALGSGADRTVVVPIQRTNWALEIPLGDGRSYRPGGDEDTPTVDLRNVDGSVVTLQHLFEVRRAVSVDDGPIVDSASIERVIGTERLDSEWIRTAEESAPSTVAVSPTSSAETESVVEGSPSSADPDIGSRLPWGAMIVVTLAASAALLSLFIAIRRRDRDAS